MQESYHKVKCTAHILVLLALKGVACKTSPTHLQNEKIFYVFNNNHVTVSCDYHVLTESLNLLRWTLIECDEVVTVQQHGNQFNRFDSIRTGGRKVSDKKMRPKEENIFVKFPPLSLPVTLSLSVTVYTYSYYTQLKCLVHYY